MASSASTSVKNGKATDVTVQDLSDQIAVLKSDISALTSTLGDFSKAKGTAAADIAKEKASEAVAAGRDKAVEAQLHAEDFIRTQPATALGLAASVGFLVGMFTARR